MLEWGWGCEEVRCRRVREVVLQSQEAIILEVVSQRTLNYGSGQLHGNNFCFMEALDATEKLNTVLCSGN